MSEIVTDYLQSLPESAQYNPAMIHNMFHEYKGVLLQWNKIMNLISENDFARIESRHFLDSAMAAKFLSNAPAQIIDIGSGAGLPGIPLKIIYPNLKLTLLDSNKKKGQFLDQVKIKLNFTDIEILSDRAEDLAKNTRKRESYDFAVTRAFAKPEAAIEMVLPFVKVGGKALFWGSAKDWSDIPYLQKILSQLGGSYQTHLEYILPEDEGELVRRITIVNKVDKTPSQYPRAVGIPVKRPLKA